MERGWILPTWLAGYSTITALISHSQGLAAIGGRFDLYVAMNGRSDWHDLE